MKNLSTIFTAGIVTLALSTPALAGSVGISRSYPTAGQPDVQTIAELEQASNDAKREALAGNKNNLAFAQKSYEINQLIARMESGQPVAQQQVDEALVPVRVW
jgi:hypothetical protein